MALLLQGEAKAQLLSASCLHQGGTREVGHYLYLPLHILLIDTGCEFRPFSLKLGGVETQGPTSPVSTTLSSLVAAKWCAGPAPRQAFSQP